MTPPATLACVALASVVGGVGVGWLWAMADRAGDHSITRLALVAVPSNLVVAAGFYYLVRTSPMPDAGCFSHSSP